MNNLKPEKVFQQFKEICNIPHGSGNVDAISDYLVAFAKEHGLWVTQDEAKNVIMIKEASAGKEDKPAIMIQGHMDMVAFKEPDADIDMTKDPLKVMIDGDYIYAKDTSLGGDDGIAIAYGLALLSDDTLQLPRIELVITTDEEVGMDGAAVIDLSPCKAMMMLNIDSEEEGQFVAACAGGIRVNGSLHVTREKECCQQNSGCDSPVECSYHMHKIMLTGFAGGHSGTEIGKHGANANKVMGWFLNELRKEVDIKLCALQGGEKDNAIPLEAEAVISVKTEQTDGFESACKELEADMKKTYQNTDPDCKVVVCKETCCENNECVWITDHDLDMILALLNEAPNGVQKMSEELPGLVQTSLNLGIMNLNKEDFQMAFSLRSSVANEKTELTNTVCALIGKYQGTFATLNDYPAWEYKTESPLREHMIAVYEKQYDKKPEVLSLHAGLECGILADKRPGLDCVSFGPDIFDIHTTRERMSISSVQRTWEFLLEVIETL